MTATHRNTDNRAGAWQTFFAQSCRRVALRLEADRQEMTPSAHADRMVENYSRLYWASYTRNPVAGKSMVTVVLVVVLLGSGSLFLFASHIDPLTGRFIRRSR